MIRAPLCRCGDPECPRCVPGGDFGPLFARPPLTRRADPATSFAAAVAVAPHVGTQRVEVLDCLTRYGPQTYKDVDRRLGWHTGAQRRLVELQRAGLARPTGERREGCRVWRAVASGARGAA